MSRRDIRVSLTLQTLSPLEEAQKRQHLVTARVRAPTYALAVHHFTQTTASESYMPHDDPMDRIRLFWAAEWALVAALQRDSPGMIDEPVYVIDPVAEARELAAFRAWLATAEPGAVPHD